MHKLKLLSLSLFCIFSMSCVKSFFTPNPFPNDSAIPSDFNVRLERTACYGKCPIYKLSINADGSAIFEGERFTQTVGKAETKLPEEKVKELISAFKNAGYFKFDDLYEMDGSNCPNSYTDAPSAITSIQINGARKTIRHYQGCKEAALTDLENKIDAIVETKRWIEEKK